MIRLPFILLLLAIAFTSPATAARTVRIIFLGAAQGAPEKLHLHDGTASQEVELPRMNLSPVYKLPDGPLVLRLLPTAAPAPPEEVDTNAPKASVSENISHLYLIVSNDPTNKVTPVKMVVVDVDPAKFRNGQMMWFNFTPNDVAGQVGSQRLVLGANSRKIIDPPASENADYNVNLVFRIPDKNEVYPLCETKWLHDDRARTIYFVIAQQGNRTPRVLGFPDYREKEKAAEEQP